MLWLQSCSCNALKFGPIVANVPRLFADIKEDEEVIVFEFEL